MGVATVPVSGLVGVHCAVFDRDLDLGHSLAVGAARSPSYLRMVEYQGQEDLAPCRWSCPREDLQILGLAQMAMLLGFVDTLAEEFDIRIGSLVNTTLADMVRRRVDGRSEVWLGAQAEE